MNDEPEFFQAPKRKWHTQILFWSKNDEIRFYSFRLGGSHDCHGEEESFELFQIAVHVGRQVGENCSAHI